MTNHPNRNWRRRWQFDTASLTAKHESGLTIQFKEADDTPGALDGEVLGGIPESLDWRSNPNILAKLMRQAGDGMMDALNQETKH
jgi:hypothetical protein